MAGVVVPWGSSGWKGIQVASGSLSGFEAPGFDDSAWPEVDLPLGSVSGGCPIHAVHPPSTTWNINTDFLLRRTITGARDLTIAYTIDNRAWIYLDGALLDFGQNNEPGNGFCPERDDHVPVTGLLTPGSHVLAIRANDFGGECYFDCEIRLTSGGGWSVGKVRIAS